MRTIQLAVMTGMLLPFALLAQEADADWGGCRPCPPPDCYAPEVTYVERTICVPRMVQETRMESLVIL